MRRRLVEAFEDVARLLPDPLILVRTDGAIEASNAPAAALWGHPRGDLKGLNLLDCVTDEPDRLRQYLAICARTRQPLPGALSVRSSGDDGGPTALRADAALFHSASTDLPALVLLRLRLKEESVRRFVILNDKIHALNREIAERRKSQEELFAHREWLRVTLESIGDAVIATDGDGRVTFLNPVSEQLTGWVSAEAVGRPLAEVFHIVHEQTRRLVENPCEKVLQHGHVVGLANHTLLISRSGAEFPIEDSAAPIKDPDGRTLGVVLVFHDVSERRQVEREREALLDAERSARSEAERSNRIKDEFLATLSHELRTPLNAILGWAQLLRTGRSSPDEVRQGLETIERNARAQTRIIEDLLDMSRIMAGKLRLDVQPLELIPIIDAAIESVRPAAEAKSIRIERSLSGSSAPVLGDGSRLQQIVWNLLSNAIKFTPRGGSVSARLNRAGSRVELSIVDTGTGIKPELLEHIFERFRQADSSTTRQHGGLGLGLAIVRQLTELHGGIVRAHSDGEGKGARFTVSLPVAATAIGRTSALRAAGDESEDAAIPLTSEVSLTGVKLLVVDDEPDARALIERVLAESGAIVHAAVSAEQALQLLKSIKPDAIISDIGMPTRDGYDLIRTIRRLDPVDGGTIPAVALTAFARSEDRTRALLAGYQIHLSKPVEPTELIAVIASLTGRTGMTPR